MATDIRKKKLKRNISLFHEFMVSEELAKLVNGGSHKNLFDSNKIWNSNIGYTVVLKTDLSLCPHLLTRYTVHLHPLYSLLHSAKQKRWFFIHVLKVFHLVLPFAMYLRAFHFVPLFAMGRGGCKVKEIPKNTTPFLIRLKIELFRIFSDLVKKSVLQKFWLEIYTISCVYDFWNTCYSQNSRFEGNKWPNFIENHISNFLEVQKIFCNCLNFLIL